MVYIWNMDLYNKIKDHIRNSHKILLYGSPGVGKTFFSRKAAEELCLDIIEINSSDTRDSEYLREILISSKTLSFRPKLFLFDEADGLYNWSIIYKIIKESKYPVIFTCNNIKKIPEFIKRNLDEVIRFPKPTKRDVVNILKHTFPNKKLDFSKVTNDIRQSIISCQFGGENYEEKNVYKDIQNLFSGKGCDNIDYIHSLFIFENIDKIYKEKDLFDMIRYISNVLLYTNNGRYLKGLKKTNKKLFLEYPKLLKRGE